ncbi:MAG TPA: SAM-dependent methyltransferase [Rhizomicrobium sp.]|nr:SAM-dependent methyltransferase [Rhizomicrobium sp.]
MNALAARIAALIAAQGPISIAQYMTMALHDPDYGYYATRDPLGPGGDFVTAPEVSQMFGEILGLWTAQAWHDQGKPSPARLVELGPGRGTLMADALSACALMPAFLDAVSVELVESNPVLRAAQIGTLGRWREKTRWAGRFEAGGKPLFLIANEFFDALPIRQFVKTPRGWCERMVTADPSGALAFALAPEPAPLPIPGPAEPGAVYEICPAATALIDAIAHDIARHGGAALIVDYGHGGGAGFGETLQALKDGAFAGLLDSPGEADLSAHVDFAALAQAAREAGCAAHGPAEQGDFLLRLGIAQRAGRLGDFEGLDRLTGTDQMGSLFKALAILPAGAPKPEGF